MDTLDLNLHQLVLRDLAASVADKDDVSKSGELAVDAISSRVRTRDLGAADTDPHERVDLASTFTPPESRIGSEGVFQSVSSVECNIAFGELAVNTREDRAEETIHVLTEILSDAAYIDFPETLGWQSNRLSSRDFCMCSCHSTGWALPDQLSFSTTSALLRLASTYPQFRNISVESVLAFCNTIVERLKSASGGLLNPGGWHIV
jgi:phosphatidylinositol 4-kinase